VLVTPTSSGGRNQLYDQYRKSQDHEANTTDSQQTG
jgi:hypothetical protein